MSNPEAEVFVLVRPDLTRFAAELEAELRALSTKGINIPITVGGPGTERQTRAIQGQLAGIASAASTATHPLEATARAMRDVGTATGTTARVTGDYMAVAGQLPPTLRQQAIASEQAARAANDLLLAEKGLTRENTTVATTSKGATEALSAQAAAATAAARNVGNFGRGVASTGLSLFGLRGATLAATTSFLAGAAGVTAFAKAIGSAVSFNTELNVLQATTGATADEMARASREARNLGRDLTLPGVSAQDAAVAITELAKAGLSVQDALDGARGSLELATAAAISNEQAVELVANALNAFQLPGKNAVAVADALANSANAAQGSIVDIGIALQQSAAVAHQAGISFRDTVVFLTELARAGLRSSDAGTSLRTALIRLINPTTKAQAILADLAKQGVRLRDSLGNIRPEFFSELGVAISGLSHSQRDFILATLGGQDAIRAFSILSRESTDSLHGLQAEIDQQGTALNVASARTKGLAGSAEQLKNNLSDLAITFGNALIPALKLFADTMNEALGATIKLIDVFKQGINPVKSFADSLGITGVASTVLSNAFRFQVSPALELFHVIKGLTSSQKEQAVQSGITAAQFKQLAGPIDFVKTLLAENEQAFRDAAKAARELDGVSLSHLQGELANLLEAVTDVQIAGGTAAQQLSALAVARAKAEELVQAIEAQPGQGNKKVAQARRQAKQDLLEIINAQQSQRQAIKAAADKAAADRKRAAAEAARKLNEADQALLDALGLRRGAAENRLARAGATRNLQDDIAFQRALTEELKRERAIVATQIHDATLRKQQVQSLTQAIIASEAATQELVRRQRDEAKARREARKQAIQDRRDRAQESRELDVQIAEAKGNKRQELVAHQALLAYLLQRRRHTTQGSLEWKRLTLDIEQERAAIKELRKAQKAATDEQKQLQFEFLQAQAGFAATVLSNILPLNTVAGSVGGGAITTPTINVPPAGFATAVHQHATAAASTRGATAGQANATIDVLRQILLVLQRIAGANEHPESTTARVITKNSLDTTYGV